MEKLRKILKLVSYDIIKLPVDVRAFANRIIVLGILGALIPDILAFALKGSQISLKNSHIIIAVVLLLFHFGERVVMSLFNTWYDLENDNYRQLNVNESTKMIMDISNTIKSKVFKITDNIVQMVEPPAILKILKDYVGSYWSLYIRLPITFAQVLILIGTLITSIIIEITGSTIAETIIITSLLVICIVVYFFLSHKRIKVMRTFRKTIKENEAVTDVLYTEIKSTDFISPKDFIYHAERLRTKLDENVQVAKTEKLKLNKIFIQRSIVASAMMITIMLIKLAMAGRFDIDVFVDIVALSSIYSTMLQRIGSITMNYENIMDLIIDLETLNPDFDNMNTVYAQERRKVIVDTPIEYLTVGKFSISHEKDGAFELINDSVFTLQSGDTVIMHGRTGCGKSTLISMFTGKMSLIESPIHFSNGQHGYLNSIGYQTDRSMVNNFVLNEIALTDDTDLVDTEKLLEIIRGLQLFDELLRMINNEHLDFDKYSDEEKIIEFLKIRKTRQFSSGQMQRLALAKLLYSLDESIQLVALDEPFNRLDDTTCKECMEFIQKYVLRSKRILFVATHQVEICLPYGNVEITFGENLKKSILRISR